jgi:hypothetical protein
LLCGAMRIVDCGAWNGVLEQNSGSDALSDPDTSSSNRYEVI